MKVYISGAITGTSDYLERFKKAEDKFIKDGISVINPARVSASLPEDTKYEEYMALSLCMLKMCDTIYMLKGWEESKGAKMERRFALAKGFMILYE